MQCPECQTQNRQGRRFCAKCGAAFTVTCPGCGFVNEAGELFCGGCGQPLVGSAPSKAPEVSSTQSSAAPLAKPGQAERDTFEPERRQLTVMFCDLVGSTALAERVDPEELHTLLARYQDTCASVIHRYDGHIARYVGDGLLVYFGYPQAHEDDPERAVRAGLGIVEAMRALETEIAKPEVSLAVRVGIATGLVIAGDIGSGARREVQAIVGQTANLAGRLQALAAPNTVVVGPGSYRLVKDVFECDDLGPQTLKGFAEPIAAYRVRTATDLSSRFEVSARRGLTPLVGRDGEIQLLLDRWEHAKQGEGQVVLIAGEAGVGKSRIVRAFRERLEGEPHNSVLYYGSAYYQHSALYPAIDQVVRWLRFEKEDNPVQKLDKLERVLQDLGLSVAELAPVLAALLSLPASDRYPITELDPERLKKRTLHALASTILAMASQHPVLMLVEDLHWLDPSTLELLSFLVGQLREARSLLVMTFRPEFVLTWENQAHATHLTLNRLSRKQTELLALRVADNKTLPREVLEEIVAKTDGVPLFVEELTKDVLESGLLQQAGDRLVLSAPRAPLAIPTSLQDSLMARLDRLGPVKEVAQLAATLGRRFDHELLASVSSLDHKRLEDALAQLIEAKLIYRRGLPPDAQYEFKHALVRDTAYQSLLKKTRQRHHRRIAQVLTERFPQLADTEPEILAQHHMQAGLMEQAVHYWQRAGQRAIERSANVEAIAHVSKGLELIEKLPATTQCARHELSLYLTLGPALIAVKTSGADVVEQAYTRARELCRQVGELADLFTVSWGLWSHYTQRAQLSAAKRFAEELLTLAKEQDDEIRLQAHHAGWSTFSALGDLSSCLHHSQQGIALYRIDKHRTHAFRYGGHDPGACARAHGALALWLSGYPDRAVEQSRDAIGLAEQLAHPYTLIHSHTLAAHVHQHRREVPSVKEHAEAVTALCNEHDITPQYGATSQILRSWAQVADGRADEQVATMRASIDAFQKLGAGLRLSYYLCLLAEAYLEIDNAEQGLRALAEAHDFLERTGERTWEAEIARLKGELLLSPSIGKQETEAQACFDQAIQVARRQAAKGFELRATTSLSRLWRDQGRHKEARDLLGPVYAWFTEGFGTADLRDARTLLDDLVQC